MREDSQSEPYAPCASFYLQQFSQRCSRRWIVPTARSLSNPALEPPSFRGIRNVRPVVRCVPYVGRIRGIHCSPCDYLEDAKRQVGKCRCDCNHLLGHFRSGADTPVSLIPRLVQGFIFHSPSHLRNPSLRWIAFVSCLHSEMVAWSQALATARYHAPTVKFGHAAQLFVRTLE
jgi:hypothetical protein